MLAQLAFLQRHVLFNRRFVLGEILPQLRLIFFREIVDRGLSDIRRLRSPANLLRGGFLHLGLILFLELDDVLPEVARQRVAVFPAELAQLLSGVLRHDNPAHRDGEFPELFRGNQSGRMGASGTGDV
jgi:hypothetical protein